MSTGHSSLCERVRSRGEPDVVSTANTHVRMYIKTQTYTYTQATAASVEQYAHEASLMTSTLQESYKGVMEWAQHTVNVINDEKQAVAAFAEQ